MKKILIKRNENKAMILLKVLALFRDRDIIHSLQEVSEYMKAYEKYDQVIVDCKISEFNTIIQELEDENVNYEIL